MAPAADRRPAKHHAINEDLHHRHLLFVPRSNLTGPYTIGILATGVQISRENASPVANFSWSPYRIDMPERLLINPKMLSEMGILS
jgi:hypothetical protein